MADFSAPPLPPADFLFLVESVLMQAQMQLGLLDLGEGNEGAPEPDLAMARHTIDLLGMLQEKTKGNLSAEEQRLLDNGLTELRFRFVQVANELQGSSSAFGVADKPASNPMIITPDGGKGSKTE